MTAFSVLDQAPTRVGLAPGQAVRDTLDLARHIDGLGFHRYWVAEHHAIDSIAISAPEVVIGQIAAVTQRVRVGSGGILLPNHRPLHVAEQFRMLEALHPGRIDLGIGRSEGATDAATVLAFGRADDLAHGGGFDAQLDELLAFGGVRPLPDDHPLASVRAVPRDVPLPPVYLLGSSLGSARTAAAKGLGYGFAAHTNPEGAAPALRHYREAFRPAREGDRPHAILAVKVMVGEDDEHARALDAPGHLAMAQHRAGSPGPLVSVEEALAHRWTAAEREGERHFDTRADVVGGPDRVRRELEIAIEAAQADEVFAVGNTFEAADRRASFQRLAVAMGVAPRLAAAAG